MAFHQTLQAPSGTNYDTAYFKIAQISLDYKAKEGSVMVDIYKDQQARNEDRDPVIQYQFRFGPQKIVEATSPNITLVHPFDEVFGATNLDTQNPQKAAYKYIRSLVQFQGATDN